MSSIPCPLQPSDPQGCIVRSPIADSTDFAKSFQFTSDGTKALTATESGLAIVNSIGSDINRHMYYFQSREQNYTATSTDHLMLVESVVPIGEAIYDLKWFPSSTQCFASTSRDHPIALWNAGSPDSKPNIVCSYRGYDCADELDSAVSMSFNLTGDKLYAGANRMIRCFDVASPGRDCFSIPTTPTKKSHYGQKGLISALSFNPDYSGTYAAGSYANSIGIYVENSAKCALLLCQGVDMGVTCLRWSPCGRYLWAGGRNSSTIQCWDIRVTQSVVGTVHRKLTTNQRMTFDLDPWGAYLCTGDQDGHLLYYDTSTFELVSKVSTTSELSATESVCVNSVVFHPYCAVVGVAAGQRVFAVDIDSDSDSDTDGSESRNVTRIGASDVNTCGEGTVGSNSQDTSLAAVTSGGGGDGNGVLGGRNDHEQSVKRRRYGTDGSEASGEEKAPKTPQQPHVARKQTAQRGVGKSSLQLWALKYTPQEIPQPAEAPPVEGDETHATDMQVEGQEQTQEVVAESPVADTSAAMEAMAEGQLLNQ